MIRAYEQRDAQRVVDIWYAASVLAHDFVPASFWRRERRTVEEVYLPMAETWVFELDGRIAAFVSMIDDGEVGALFVDPAEQGKGIGRALIEHVARLEGSLRLHVFRENHRAVAFYERLGFREAGQSVEEKTGHAQILMVRDGAEALRA